MDSHTQHSQDKQNDVPSFAFVICICLAICFSFALILNLTKSETLNDKINLDQKINPNNAPIASLARLLGIGILRAKAIVAYRENFRKQNANAYAFQDCQDLQKVKGIGPKTIQNISQWLKFE